MCLSSFGVTNLSQVCVPFGTRPNKYSAAKIANKYDCGVLLIVVIKENPLF